ncbi:hypothetical protein H8E50_11905, partial [bacterium]|nr:hypothetical protein [bacterium]
FSHDKHAIWNGCDSCHPLIYETLEGPVTFFSMNDIFAGKYCGVCHGKVSFPPLQCQRCHSDFIP